MNIAPGKLLVEGNKRQLANPSGKGIPAERVLKSVKEWVQDAKRKKRGYK
jgi:hypothetical protein